MSSAQGNRVRISVIVPVFNVERYIQRTLRSVIEQGFEAIELIVVDDGSTDGTLSRIMDVVESVPLRHHVLHQHNQGVSAARNRGLDVAAGEFVYFLDGDDVIEPMCLSRLYERASSHDVDAVFCGFDVVDECGESLRTYLDAHMYIEGVVPGRDALIMQLTQRIWIWTASALWRTALLREHKIRYPEGCTLGEDQVFIMKALFHARAVTSVHEVLAHYVQRPNSVTRVASSSGWRTTLTAFKDLSEYFERQTADSLLTEYLRRYTIPQLAANVVAALAREGHTWREIRELLSNDIHALADFRWPWKLVGTAGMRPFVKNLALRLWPELVVAYYCFANRRSPR